MRCCTHDCVCCVGQRNGRLKGHYQTLQYLQRLGPDHLDLILEFSKWVMAADAEVRAVIYV